MKSIKRRLSAWMAAGLGLTLLFPGPSLAQDTYKAIAKEFSRAAVKHNAGKVAVIPFTLENGSDSLAGKAVAERIATQVARLGKVELVERELLPKVMQERYLAEAAGAFGRGPRNSAAILPVDAIITGSLFAKGNRVEIHARMIDVKTGKVLFADAAEAEKEWTEIAAVPSFQVPVPAIEVDAPPVFHDALANNACEQADDRLAELESSILDAKARYWAARLKSPDFSMAKLTRNPGSEIADEALRERFYDLLKEWYRREDAPRLSPEETARMTQVEARIRRIMEKCNG